MTFSLKDYNQTVNELLEIAENNNIPHLHLRLFRNELDAHIKQILCRHKMIYAAKIGNLREWKCETCGKTIDYETIE